MEIDHINDIRDDNRLRNLQLVTPSENSKKAAANRDYSFVKYNHKNIRPVKAVNLKTNEVHYSPSFYRSEKELGVTCEKNLQGNRISQNCPVKV